MNPFVDDQKRGIELPEGCKDLIHVLQLARAAVEEPPVPRADRVLPVSLVGLGRVWAPRIYRLPANTDLVLLCRRCLRTARSAMDPIPPHLVEEFQLELVDDRELEDAILG